MDRIDSGQGGDLGASDSAHLARVLASVSGLVSGVTWSQDDSIKMTLSLLPVLHHPTVIQADQKIWKRTTSKLGLTPEKVIKENGKDVLKIVTQLIQNNTNVGRESYQGKWKRCFKNCNPTYSK